MFGNEFYHETIRRYVVVFGTMFNDLVVWRRDTSGNIIKRIKVPISYGPKAMFLTRLQQDPNLSQPSAITLPRMSFQIVGYNFDVNRKLNTVGQIKAPATSSTKNSAIYNPVPYNIDFELSIYCINAEDGTQILEQILPFFTPEWTNTMKLIDDLDLLMDVPVVLNTIVTTDSYEDSYVNRRSIIHTLSFTMKGYMFGPVKDKNIILNANTRFYVDGFSANTEAAAANNREYYEYTYVRPGLDANGNPTSNEAISIAANLISSNDNWDYIVRTVVNPDLEDDQT